ncbi:MAG: ATPase [Pseudomonas sp.]
MVEQKQMKAETFEQLVDWTSGLHKHLAESLEQGEIQAQGEKAQWLLHYLAEHERTLTDVVQRMKEKADPKALNTWLYEHLSEKMPPANGRQLSFSNMDFEEISAQIFEIHNQLIELYRSMSGRAPTPEIRELMEELLDLEEHETLRLAGQVDSVRGM